MRCWNCWLAATSAAADTSPEVAVSRRRRWDRRLTLLFQVPAELADHLARVVLDAAQERGLAPPQYGQAQGVQAGTLDGAAIVPELAPRVEDRHVEQAVVGPEPGRPEDRPDLIAAQVELPARRGRRLGRGEALVRVDLRIRPGRVGPLVEPA